MLHEIKSLNVDKCEKKVNNEYNNKKLVIYYIKFTLVFKFI